MNEKSKSRPSRVLCVDDNRDAADTLARILEIYGFNVRICYNGLCALREALSFEPHAVLLDLNMPGMDGDVVAVRLRQENSDKTFFMVALTAANDSSARERLKSAGFDVHLIKPVDPEYLRIILRNRD